MPQLLDSICTIIGVFSEHAKCHGDCSALKRREMKGLIWKEFSEVIQNPHDPETVELMFQLLDINQDGLVDFNEYLMIIFKVAKASYSHLQPRECLLQEEEARRAQREGELQGDARDRRQLCGDEREGNYTRERRDSDWTRHRPIEGTTRGGEGRRDYLPCEPEAQLDERSRQTPDPQLRDGRGRDRPSRELQKWEGENQGRPRESEPQAGAELEPRRDGAGQRQLRRREPDMEDDRQHRSQDLGLRDDDERRHPACGFQPQEGEERDQYSREAPQRWEDGRQSRTQETKRQVDEENRTRRPRSEPRVDEGGRCRPRAPEETRYDDGGCRPSRGSQELGERRRRDYPDEQGERRRRDYPDEQEIQDKVRSPEHERCRDQTYNQELTDEEEQHLPLPREGERRSHLRDPECEQRRSQTRESERRERFRPSTADRREDVWTRQQRGGSQSREVEQFCEPEVTEAERRRSQPRDQGEWTGPRTQKPTERAEMEDQRRSRNPERREQERGRLRPYEPEPTESGRRWPQSCEFDPREGDSRRPWPHDEDDRRKQQEDRREEEVERRRPESLEVDPSDCDYSGPQRRERELRGDHQDSQQYQEVESERRRSQKQDSESRDGEKRNTQAHGETSREDVQRSRAYHQSEPLQKDGERRKPQGCEPTLRDDHQMQQEPEAESDTELRKLQVYELARREHSQGRPQPHEPESWERGSEWRRPQLHDAEGERRRPLQANSRCHESPRSAGSLTRPQQQERSSPSNGGSGGRGRDRQQVYESEPRETERRMRQLRNPKCGDRGQSRQMYDDPEENGKRKPLPHEPECRVQSV